MFEDYNQLIKISTINVKAKFRSHDTQFSEKLYYPKINSSDVKVLIAEFTEVT